MQPSRSLSANSYPRRRQGAREHPAPANSQGCNPPPKLSLMVVVTPYMNLVPSTATGKVGAGRKLMAWKHIAMRTNVDKPRLQRDRGRVTRKGPGSGKRRHPA